MALSVHLLPLAQREAVLADPHTLALWRFDAAAATAHPREVGVALPQHGPPMLEAWRSDAPCRDREHAGIAVTDDGHWHWLRLEVDDGGDAEAATRAGYARLYAALDALGLHALRIWNYLDAITAGDGDDERYRRFCVGRAAGIGQALAPERLPAATAIGHPQATGRLQLVALAATRPGHALENPRQLAAWRYPRQYGPQPPGFARALLPDDAPLLLSGTASILGHASTHDAPLAQLQEILRNLGALIAQARQRQARLPARLGATSRLRVYVRNAADLPAVARWCADTLVDVPHLVLQGAVCRRELRVEIEGVHGPA